MNTEFFTKQVAGRAKYALQWQTWLYSLIAGAIGGGAQSLSQVAVFSIASASGANVRVLNWTEIKLTFVCGALTFLVGYFAKSPLPPLVEETITTTTVADTHTEKTTVSPAPKPLDNPPAGDKTTP